MSHQSELISQIFWLTLNSTSKRPSTLLTCGNVDDGKSTLIGRLLFDSKLIYEDQLQAVTRDSKKSALQGMHRIWLFWLTVYKQNASRALRLMSLTVISQQKSANSLLPIHRDMSSILGIWQPVPRPVTLPLF